LAQSLLQSTCEIQKENNSKAKQKSPWIIHLNSKAKTTKVEENVGKKNPW
jgi:hypothetical protein